MVEEKMLESEIFEKIKVYEDNYNELMQKIAEAGQYNDVETIKECGKKIAELEEIIGLAKKLSDASRSNKRS